MLTYRYRIKDATCGRHLRRQAREVSRVWNYCGEIQNAARRHNRRWPSGFDLIRLTHERALAIAQRAGRTTRVRAIHARIANCRRHFLHGLSTRLARENRRICVGNVNSSGLARTRLAKSVLDAGGSLLRSQLHYKA